MAALGFRAGMHPLHTLQALTRGGLPLADAARAVSLARAMAHTPLKTSVLLTAKAMGLPSLPVRLASIGWSVARDFIHHVLTR